MKKVITIISVLAISLLISLPVYVSDNVFAGTEMGEEIYEDLNIIIEESNGIASYKDGELTINELNFDWIQRIYIDTLPYFFTEEKITAESLKELIDESDYMYYMPVHREQETVFLNIAKGQELTESDYELLEQVSAPDDEIEKLERDVDHWCVMAVSISDGPTTPGEDYMGLMESYLEYKGIHNAEVYFVSRINPKSMMTGVVFTGNKTDSGEDEIIFVAIDTLQYDEEGYLISVEMYEEDDGDFEVEDAEYTYAELRELSKEFDEMESDMAGGAGGGIGSSTNYGVYIAIIAGVILLVVIIALVAKKKMKR